MCFSCLDKETNVIAFKDGPMEYSGTFKFSEAEDASKQGAIFRDFIKAEKKYELEIVIDSCVLTYAD